jgi:hypothetical protein
MEKYSAKEKSALRRYRGPATGLGTKWVCHLLSGDCTPAFSVLQGHDVESAKHPSAMSMMMDDTNNEWTHDDLSKDPNG